MSARVVVVSGRRAAVGVGLVMSAMMVVVVRVLAMRRLDARWRTSLRRRRRLLQLVMHCDAIYRHTHTLPSLTLFTASQYIILHYTFKLYL